jgi:hypothetical protein
MCTFHPATLSTILVTLASTSRPSYNLTTTVEPTWNCLRIHLEIGILPQGINSESFPVNDDPGRFALLWV